MTLKGTALSLASQQGRTNMVQALLQRQANPYLQNYNGHTAFDVAKNQEIIELLQSS